MSPSGGTRILVTGGSGFLSLHCIAQALTAGYKVRTTIRSDTKKQNVMKGLKNAQPPVDTSKLEFVIANLLKEEGWGDAVRDISLILHVASPFPAVLPKDENELIRPAVDGTLRVLKAAKLSGTVKRVVLTSSAAAIEYGTPYVKGKVYTEADWSDPEGKGSYISPYAKSKTLAERAAWDFIEREGGSLELTVVNPHAIYGPPLLLPNESTTCNLIKQFLNSNLSAVPNVSFGIVDVRDVASLHILAATAVEAAGQRYSCLAGKSVSLPEMAAMLKAGLGAKASKAPTKTMPSFVVKLLSHVMAQLEPIKHDLGKRKEFSNEKAKALGWSPRSNEEAVVSCGQALIDAEIKT